MKWPQGQPGSGTSMSQTREIEQVDYIMSCCNMCCDTEFLRPCVLDASDLTFVFVRKNGLAIVSDLTLKQTYFAFSFLSFWSSLLGNNPELVRRVIITTTINSHSHCSFMWIRISSALVNQKQIEKQTGLWGLCKMKSLLSISFLVCVCVLKWSQCFHWLA